MFSDTQVRAVKDTTKIPGQNSVQLNPIQLRGGGGGLFGPDPENKVTINGLI